MLTVRYPSIYMILQVIVLIVQYELLLLRKHATIIVAVDVIVDLVLNWTVQMVLLLGLDGAGWRL